MRIVFPTVENSVIELVRTRRAWAAYLDDAEWSLFATLTTRQPTSAITIRRHFQNRFIRWLARISHSPPAWFYVIESGSVDERVHLHALLYAPAVVDKEVLKMGWDLGFCDVREFRLGTRVCDYLTKSLDPDRDEYDVSRRWPPHRSPDRLLIGPPEGPKWPAESPSR